MALEHTRGLAGLLSRWTGRHDEPGHHDGRAGQPLATKVLPRFLASLRSREAPVIVDLGPVVGSNISFFGDRLGCKIFVEDLYNDLERFTKEGRVPAFPAFLEQRFTRPDASVDGILCWDFFDYLDRPAAKALGRELTRLLKPGGALCGFFSTERRKAAVYNRYTIVDDTTLEHRTYPSARPPQPVLMNRDITALFDGLRVTDSFLLLTTTREFLFRRPELPRMDVPHA